MNDVTNPRTIKARAVYYLSKRDYSRSELTKKLLSAFHTNTTEGLQTSVDIEVINSVLDDLQAKGFLNDARFASVVANRKAVKYGVARISAMLSQHQLNHQITSDLIQSLKETELQRCYVVWNKKFNRLDNLAILSYQDQQAAPNKQVRFLIQRGFSPEVVRKVLNGWQPVE
jgi:regulatory protein